MGKGGGGVSETKTGSEKDKGERDGKIIPDHV